MPSFYASVTDELREWALAQPFFFVASAPSFGRHVNVSPKGHTAAAFAFLGPNSCAYLDAAGSGCETAAHVRENGRITLMWLSLGPSPRILRLFGTGRIAERNSHGPEGTPEFEAALALMKKGRADLAPLPAQGDKGGDGARAFRSVITVDVWKVQTSCGFGVPLMAGLAPAANGTVQAPNPSMSEAAAPESLEDVQNEVLSSMAQEKADLSAGGHHYKGPPYQARKTLANAMAMLGKGDGHGVAKHQIQYNTASLDGLPGYRSARRMRWNRGTMAERARFAGTLLALDVANTARRLWVMREALVLGLTVGFLVGMLAGCREDAGLSHAAAVLAVFTSKLRGMSRTVIETVSVSSV